MRNIYIVNATQVVTSDSHPEGLFSVVSGFPQYFDSRSYDADAQHPDGNEEKALRMAKSAYLTRLAANYAADNRAMTTVTLERADGRMIMHESIGAFPVIEPEPAPEPETPEEGGEGGEPEGE